MTNNGVEQKPSETALFAALRRTLAHKEYKNERFGPDDIAEVFLPPHFRLFLKFRRIRENTKSKLDASLPGVTVYMIARTAYFDRLFLDALNDKTPQIVLLGAGYDSRAVRFASANQGTRIFELDAAPTQERKVQCLRKARITIPEQVTFMPMDFNQESLGDALEKAGYKNDQKALFLWEGVSYYLERASVDNTLAFVSHASHPESAIAFDYTVSVSEENADEVYGVKEFAQSMKEHHASEELMFSIEEGGAEAFLRQRGLRTVDHLDNEQIERAFLLDENGSLIGRMTGHFRFVLASPEVSEGHENPASRGGRE